MTGRQGCYTAQHIMTLLARGRTEVQKARVAERERCAKIAEETPVVQRYKAGKDNRMMEDARATKRRIADKIRAASEVSAWS